MRAYLIMKKLIPTFILLVFLAPVLFAQNPVTNTVQAGPAKAKESEPKIGEKVYLTEPIGGPMVSVPAGEFFMGCNEGADKECYKNEKPYHRVYLDAYYIDKYELTNMEYTKCIGAGGCKEPKWGNWHRDLSWENHPVVGITWIQAEAYCKWAGKRLPTEAEWEKAAKGTDGRIYPWGDEAGTCEYAILFEDRKAGCGRNSTWPVGSKPKGASPYGVMDMAGNVFEWVSDWYDGKYYKNSPASNPSGPMSGGDRVWRGGSWYQYNYPTSRRSHSKPDSFGQEIGFRCARDAK